MNKKQWARVIPTVLLLVGILGFQSTQTTLADLPPALLALQGAPCAASGNDWGNLNVDSFVSPSACSTNNGASANQPLTGFLKTDPTGNTGDPTTFFTGSSKTTTPLAGWLNTTGSSPAKADIEHGFTAAYQSGGKLIVFSGLDRLDNSGDTNVGTWLFKSPVFCCNSSNRFTQQDPVKNPNAPVALHSNGDLLIESDFTTGGSVPGVTVQKWVCTTQPNSNLCTTDSTGQDTGSLTTVSSNGAADCQSSTFSFSANDYCATVDEQAATKPACTAAGTIQTAWTYADKSNCTVSGKGRYLPGEFYEMGIDISDAVPGDVCFASQLDETQSATSGAVPAGQDFVLGGFSTCKARISLSPLTATNSIGATHTITATVQYQTGSGIWSSAPDGTIVTPTITTNPTATLTKGGTCTTTGTSSGTCTITVESDIPTTVTVNASASFSVSGDTLTADTTDPANLGLGGTGAASKVFVAAEIKLSKTVDVGPFTAATQVCFTLAYDTTDTTNPTVSPISSDSAHQCQSVTANTTGAIISETLNYDWRNLATHHYNVTEDALPAGYGTPTLSWTNPVFVDAVNGPTLLSLTANDPLLPGSLFIHKTVNGGAVPSGASFQFEVSQCDGTSTATQCNNPTAVTGSPFTLTGTGAAGGDQISKSGLAEGYYKIHESSVPSGYSINSGDPSIVQVHAGQTTAQSFNTGLFDNALLYKVIVFVCDSQGNLHSASVSTSDTRMGGNAPQSTMSVVPNGLPNGTTAQNLCSEGPASYSSLRPNTGSNTTPYKIDSINIQP